MMPNPKLGSSGDFAVFRKSNENVILFFKINRDWVQLNKHLRLKGNPKGDELAKFENSLTLNPIKNMSFKNDEGLKVKTINQAEDDTDKFLVSDSGVIKYRDGKQIAGDIGESIVTTGALDSGSITSGFGNIDIGSSTIDTTGNVSVGDLQVNGNDINFDAASSNIAIDASAHDTVGKNLAILAGNTTAGTTDDIAGGHISLYAGRGKGSGSGGSIKLYVADGGSSGSSLNAYATAMTIDDDLKLTAKGDVEVDGGDLYVKGASGYVAEMFIIADDGEDNADEWKISAADAAGSNIFSFSNKISGSHVNHFYINPNATVASSSATLAGSLAVNGTNGITAGAVIWQSFPFIASSITASRGFYFRDNDDPEDFRKWDEFDADMVLVYGRIYGHYVVPEDCTLKHMRGIVANDGSTDDVIINVWYCLQTNIQTDTTSTTFTKAGSDTDVTIGTSEVGVQFNEDYDVDLTAGSIVIPTIKNGGAGFDSFLGSLTLKFITR